MEDMLALAYKENIIVEEFYLKEPLQGIYICQSNRPPLIGLSTAIKNIYEKRSIMAEELGHHFTTVGECLPREFYNYSTRSTINKIEYKAMRWAANHLIPDIHLLESLRDGLGNSCELAEHFRVSPEIAQIKLEVFRKTLLQKIKPTSNEKISVGSCYF